MRSRDIKRTSLVMFADIGIIRSLDEKWTSRTANLNLLIARKKKTDTKKRIYSVWGLKMFENAVQSVQEGGQDVGKTYKSQLESVQDRQETASRKGCVTDS